MLRGVLLALLLANLAFFVWSQGGFGTAGGAAAAGDQEPERLARQVYPEVVQLLTPPVAALARAPVAATAASAASVPVSGASGAASEAASAPAAAEIGASASSTASTASAASAAASMASAGAAAVAMAAPAPSPAAAPVPPAPPGTRCLEAGPFSGAELALAETALAASAKTRRIARRWVPITPDAASAPAAPQHRLRIDATPDEVAVLEALPASAVGRSFTPCTSR